MKVLILTTVLAPYRIDYFNELGKFCDLTVCFETKADSSRDENWYKKEFHNFKAVFIKGWDRSQSSIKKEILKHVNKNEFDIAVAFEYHTPTAMLFMLANIIKGRPYCINVDGGFVSDNMAKTAVKRFFMKRAAACLAGGDMAARYCTHYGASAEHVFIHNFTSLRDLDIIEKELSYHEKLLLKAELGIPPAKTAIAIGQFIHRKGFDVLIKAWKSINSDCNLLIIGGGEKEKEYRELIKELQLNNIMILGFKKKDELKKYYMASDIFVLPTREDIWGLVINEAMACGLPVITTDKCVAGLELIKNDENGYIVSVEDVKMLSQKISKLLQDDHIREKMSANNLEKIRSYTIENMAKVNHETFVSILKGKK